MQQRFFRSGLADAASHGNDLRLGTGPCGASQFLQCRLGVFYQNDAGISRQIIRAMIENKGRCPACSGSGRECVTVMHRTDNGNEKIARLQGPAVDGNTTRGPVCMIRPACDGGNNLFSRPEGRFNH
jgi:hypothetical protein